MYNLYRAQWEVGHHSAAREAARRGRVFRPSSSVEDALLQNRNTPFLGGTPLLDEIPSFIKCLQSQHVSFWSHLTSSPEHRFGVLYHPRFARPKRVTWSLLPPSARREDEPSIPSRRWSRIAWTCKGDEGHVDLFQQRHPCLQKDAVLCVERESIRSSLLVKGARR